MTCVSKTGEQVQVEKLGKPQALRTLVDQSDDEIRRLFAKTLRLAGIDPERAARILRTSKRTHYRDLAAGLRIHVEADE